MCIRPDEPMTTSTPDIKLIKGESMDKRRVNVRAIIWRDGKLLAVRHKSKSGGAATYWCIPGGGLDPGESLQEGVAREVMEETGIEAKVGKLLFIQQFNSHREGYNEELEFFFHIENPEDFDAIDLTNTSHGLEEIAHIEFIDPAVEYILPTLMSTVPIGDYIASDKPVYFHNELGK